MNDPAPVTRLLGALREGNRAALDQLMPLVYDELRRIADARLRAERPGHTLQPTALVHEAFLRMVGQQQPDFQSRSQFFAIAARVMRQILVDHARRTAAAKRGGEKRPIDEALAKAGSDPAELLDLDVEAEELAVEHEHAHDDEHEPGADLDDGVVALEEPEGAGGGVERHGGEQERQREPCGVDGQQQRALPGARAGGGEAEDGAERRTDARRPGDGERGAGDDGSAAPGALDEGVRAELAVQARDEHRRHEQRAHGDDGHAGDLVERGLGVEQERADGAGSESQQDEQRRERRHKQRAAAKHVAVDSTATEPRGLDPRDGGQIARYERQTARRHERHDAGGKRKREARGLNHGGRSDGCRRRACPAWRRRQCA